MRKYAPYFLCLFQLYYQENNKIASTRKMNMDRKEFYVLLLLLNDDINLKKRKEKK
jgi:hypothetical protein